MSRILTGVTGRSWLKLAGVVGYISLMMTSLFGAPSSLAQSPTSVATTVASNLTVKPANLDFGSQPVLPPDGAVSKPRSITLSVAKNQPQPVTIEQPLMVSDSNTPPVQFIVQPNTCTVIAPGTSCSVPIVFQPNGARGRRAVVLITSNANNGVQSVNLMGTGKTGMLSINPNALNFPTAMVGGSPTASRSTTLTNRNPIPLTIRSVTSSNPSVFLVNNQCPSFLQPSASCTVAARFAPDRNGMIGGKLIIADNAMGPDKIQLTGTGQGGPTATRTATPTRSPTPSPTKDPGPFPMRAFPAIH